MIDEINNISKNQFGDDVHIDMNNLTIAGHGLGATTAIALASKDDRIKKVISLDPWLTPIKDEVEKKTILVK